MPHDTPDWSTLERYLAGDCPPDERARVEAWMAESADHRTWVESLRRITGAIGPPTPGFDPKTQRAWSAAARRLGLQPGVAGASQPLSLHLATRQRGHRMRNVVLGAAAAVLVVGVVLTRVGREDGRGATPREYATGAGERQIVTLTDGSRITLAPLSRVRVGRRFGSGSRDLELDGEALFAVVHDPARPFLVRTRSVVVHDIGTTFDIRCYRDDASARVAVTDGRVMVGVTALGAGDLAIVDRRGTTIAHNADVRALTSWSTGTLTFRDAPLPQVAVDLSRWFGVTIRLGDDALRHRHIDVTIDGGSITTVLDALAAGVSARYDVRDSAVYTLHSVPATP